ncbi:hypothetical protein F442_07847 [Phytophthora nicotianae P10297]|uniref:Uncharacterized protein n=2 Tax=Phytophthora nicotianae TaxID=4792 RepID=V9F8Z2_PHYNI|nr:hypothetical protein F443_07908 [Phytophthora nicotianae P1569]ETI47994.1 hypothetical protein F443_07906 [Phytophthora nicotianae P1569]ETP45805.1 hypothetical protein F442_07847 [Phytophthora nicotianae P10297]
MSGNVSIGSCGGGTTRSAGTRSDNVNTPAILQLPLHPTAPLKKSSDQRDYCTSCHCGVGPAASTPCRSCWREWRK